MEFGRNLFYFIKLKNYVQIRKDIIYSNIGVLDIMQ